MLGNDGMMEYIEAGEIIEFDKITKEEEFKIQDDLNEVIEPVKMDIDHDTHKRILFDELEGKDLLLSPITSFLNTKINRFAESPGVKPRESIAFFSTLKDEQNFFNDSETSIINQDDSEFHFEESQSIKNIDYCTNEIDSPIPEVTKMVDEIDDEILMHESSPLQLDKDIAIVELEDLQEECSVLNNFELEVNEQIESISNIESTQFLAIDDFAIKEPIVIDDKHEPQIADADDEARAANTIIEEIINQVIDELENSTETEALVNETILSHPVENSVPHEIKEISSVVNTPSKTVNFLDLGIRDRTPANDEDKIQNIDTDFSDYPAAKYNPFENEDVVFFGTPKEKEKNILKQLNLQKTVKKKAYESNRTEVKTPSKMSVSKKSPKVLEQKADNKSRATTPKISKVEVQTPNMNMKTLKSPSSVRRSTPTAETPTRVRLPMQENKTPKLLSPAERSMSTSSTPKASPKSRIPSSNLSPRIDENTNKEVSRIPKPSIEEHKLLPINKTPARSASAMEINTPTPIRQIQERLLKLRINPGTPSQEPKSKRLNMSSTPVKDSPAVRSWLDKRKPK